MATANLTALLMKFGLPVKAVTFPEVFDGNSPILDLDYQDGLWLFNGTIYKSEAAFATASGGAHLGSGRVPIASLGAAPWTFQFSGIAPTVINANRNYAFSYYGGTTNLAYVRLDQATNNSQYTVINNSVTQASFTNPVASNLGTQWSCAGVLGSNIAIYASAGRDTGTPDTVVSLPPFNTGIALAYNPAAANGDWRGTFQRLTIWPGNLGASAVRALSTGNLYGPSRVALSGYNRQINVGSYTYVNEVGSDGSQICIKIRNDNRQMVGIKAIATSPGIQDQHNTADQVVMANGGMCWCWTNHDNGNVFYWTTSPDTNMDNAAFRSIFTLGGGLIPAYGTLRIQASTGYLFFLFRTNQSYWSIARSTDNGGSWALLGGGSGRFLDDSAHGGDKLLVSAAQWVDANTLRCMANREPQYLDTEIRMLDLNVSTLDITAGGASIGTIGTGNGALMANCSLVWNPSAGFSAFCRDFKVWNQGLAGLLDEGTSVQDYYWLNCNNPANPFVSASWDKVLICSAVTAGKAGGGCTIGVSGLSTPQVAISRYVASEGRYHLETWVASDAAGSSWSVLNSIAVGGGSDDTVLGSPGSANGADPRVPLTWLDGRLTNYDDYAQQLYWQRNAV